MALRAQQAGDWERAAIWCTPTLPTPRLCIRLSPCSYSAPRSAKKKRVFTSLTQLMAEQQQLMAEQQQHGQGGETAAGEAASGEAAAAQAQAAAGSVP
jgi:hypothetical protein